MADQLLPRAAGKGEAAWIEAGGYRALVGIEAVTEDRATLGSGERRSRRDRTG
jgi:hypothetical protein